MKKALAIVAIVLAIAAAFIVGRHNGIQHAITDCEIWLAEWEEAEHGDWIINLDLDGETYVHELCVY